MRPPAGANTRGTAGVGRAEILLVLGSLLFLPLIALIGELAVRGLLDINFLGNSRDLFVANAYGSSKGNAPSAEAISFGAVVYTDEHGFRVPEGGLPDDANKPEAILILGDSVAFGPAVEEGETFAGLLRARFPARRVYNSSVIGYSTPDYKNVVDAFLPLHAEVTDVVLVYCLNDVSSKSAEAIDRYLATKQEKTPEPDLRQALQGLGPLRSVNDFLRSRSKLYLLLKHRVMASQRRGWEEVARLYADGAQANLEGAARDIADIAARLKEEHGSASSPFWRPSSTSSGIPTIRPRTFPRRSSARCSPEWTSSTSMHAPPSITAATPASTSSPTTPCTSPGRIIA